MSGICLLISPTTRVAWSMAGRATSAQTPRLEKPASFGGVIWTKATSMGICPDSNTAGIW
jgi:hypothetical protein